MRAWVVEMVAPLLAVSVVLIGVLTLGRLAAEDLRARGGRTTAFAELRCDPPAGLRRDEFLREVQYEAELPDQFGLLDGDLPDRLRAAFLRHPWVEEVERLEVRASGSVQVRLRYRTPALAVPTRERVRVVDRHGVLLPRAAAASGLPVFRGKPSSPSGPTGTSWGDPQVLTAARMADFLRPARAALRLAEVEVVGEELVLWTPDGLRILWGSLPGEEGPGEAAAALKRERLARLVRQAAQAGHAPHSGGPPEDSCEYDLRPAARAMRRTPSRVVQVGARGKP